jgi:hypothetical protein
MSNIAQWKDEELKESLNHSLEKGYYKTRNFGGTEYMIIRTGDSIRWANQQAARIRRLGFLVRVVTTKNKWGDKGAIWVAHKK